VGVFKPGGIANHSDAIVQRCEIWQRKCANAAEAERGKMLNGEMGDY